MHTVVGEAVGASVLDATSKVTAAWIAERVTGDAAQARPQVSPA
jgi:hypothetical protein